jgi:hypothetical protein
MFVLPQNRHPHTHTSENTVLEWADNIFVLPQNRHPHTHTSENTVLEWADNIFVLPQDRHPYTHTQCCDFKSHRGRTNILSAHSSTVFSDVCVCGCLFWGRTNILSAHSSTVFSDVCVCGSPSKQTPTHTYVWKYSARMSWQYICSPSMGFKVTALIHCITNR